MAVGLWVYHIQSMHVPVFSLAHIKVFHTWPAARKVSYIPKIFAFLNFLPTFAFVQFNLKSFVSNDDKVPNLSDMFPIQHILVYLSVKLPQNAISYFWTGVCMRVQLSVECMKDIWLIHSVKLTSFCTDFYVKDVGQGVAHLRFRWGEYSHNFKGFVSCHDRINLDVSCVLDTHYRVQLCKNAIDCIIHQVEGVELGFFITIFISYY